MSTVSELFLELKYDKMKDSLELGKEACRTCVRNEEAKFLEFHSHRSSDEFLSFIKEHTELFIQIEEIENFKPQSVSRHEIDLAIKFMEYHEDNHVDISSKSCHALGFIIAKRLSLFEIILALYRNVKWNLMSHIEVSKRRFVLIEQLRQFIHSPFTQQSYTVAQFESSFCTMIVFDSSDIESATDCLSNAFYEDSLPWKIRYVFVQESISKRFVSSIKRKLRPFHELYLNDGDLTGATTLALGKAFSMGLTVINSDDDTNVLKPSIVLGQDWTYFDDGTDNPLPTIIVLNVFRTAKECVSLANSQLRGSATIWTQNISLAYEMVNQLDASTFWLNCHGIFDPMLPYQFSNPCELYGSDFFRFAPFNEIESYTKHVGLPKYQSKKSLKEDFSLSKIDGKIHYECFSVPDNNLYHDDDKHTFYKLIKIRNEKFWLHSSIRTYEKQQASNQVKTILNNLQYNKRKTVAFEFGVTFGN